MTFESIRNDLVSLHTAGKYADALAFLEGYEPGDSDQATQIAYWRACLLALTRDKGGAISVLESAMDDRRIWYSPQTLREDEDFASLQDEPGFRRVMEMAEERYFEARANESGKHLLIRSNRPQPRFRGALMVLHGNNSHLRETQPAWEPLVEDGWSILMVESSQVGYYTFGRVWNDYDRAREDVLAAAASLSDRERGKLVVAGFSRGARTALQLALDGTLPVKAVFAHEPAPSAGFAEWYAETKGRSLPLFLTIGEKDPDRDMSEEIATVVGDAARVRLLAGATHEYPERFSELVRDTLRDVS